MGAPICMYYWAFSVLEAAYGIIEHGVDQFCIRAGPDRPTDGHSIKTIYHWGEIDLAGRYMEFSLPPTGVTFASLPTAMVETGDVYLDIAGMALYNQDRTLRIPVLSSSNIAPSQIKISNVRLNISNTVPQGELVLWISGTAIGDVGPIIIANGI